MNYRLLGTGAAGERSYIVVLEGGADVLASLQAFADGQELTAAALQGIGAFEKSTCGFYDFDREDYDPIQIDEQTELLSLLGNITLDADGSRYLHIHVTLGKRDGSVWGGHLLAATVKPTLELFVTEYPGELRRVPEQNGVTVIAPALTSGE